MSAHYTLHSSLKEYFRTLKDVRDIPSAQINSDIEKWADLYGDSIELEGHAYAKTTLRGLASLFVILELKMFLNSERGYSIEEFVRDSETPAYIPETLIRSIYTDVKRDPIFIKKNTGLMEGIIRFFH